MTEQLATRGAVELTSVTASFFPHCHLGDLGSTSRSSADDQSSLQYSSRDGLRSLERNGEAASTQPTVHQRKRSRGDRGLLASNRPKASTMGELPAELIQKILAEADLATIVAAGGVNAAWRAVVKDVSVVRGFGEVVCLSRSGFTRSKGLGRSRSVPS